MTYQHITVEPLAGAIGAEISGPDLSQPVTSEVLDEIQQAFLENQVIVFRNQELTPDSHKAFARHFGSAHINDFFPTVEGHPDVQLVAKNPEDTRNVGDVWPTDVSYVAKPPMGSMLYALEVPEAGGDTMFASMYASYDALSDGMKELLERLNAVHSATKSFGTNATGPEMRAKNKSMKFKYSEDAEQVAVHPVVQVHPDERPQRSVRKPLLHQAFRRDDRRGKRPAVDVPIRPHGPAGIHLPRGMARGHADLLGQSLHAPQCDQRLSGPAPPYASGHRARR